MIALTLLTAGHASAPNGHPSLAILGAVTGTLGTLLGGYAALNAFFAKRAKADADIRGSLVALRDVLASVRAAPDRVPLLGSNITTAHVDNLEENVGKVTSFLLRRQLRQLVAKVSEAARMPAASQTGQGSHAVQSKVDAAYKLACSAIERLDGLVRRSPT